MRERGKEMKTHGAIRVARATQRGMTKERGKARERVGQTRASEARSKAERASCTQKRM